MARRTVWGNNMLHDNTSGYCRWCKWRMQPRIFQAASAWRPSPSLWRLLPVRSLQLWSIAARGKERAKLKRKIKKLIEKEVDGNINDQTFFWRLFHRWTIRIAQNGRKIETFERYTCETKYKGRTKWTEQSRRILPRYTLCVVTRTPKYLNGLPSYLHRLYVYSVIHTSISTIIDPAIVIKRREKRMVKCRLPFAFHARKTDDHWNERTLKFQD